MCGDDFLDGGYKADMVVLCNVFNPGLKGDEKLFKDRDPSIFGTSPKHHEKQIWFKAVMDTGANIISVYPGDSEPWKMEGRYREFFGNKFEEMERQGQLSGVSEIRSRHLMVGDGLVRVYQHIGPISQVRECDIMVRKGFSSMHPDISANFPALIQD